MIEQSDPQTIDDFGMKALQEEIQKAFDEKVASGELVEGVGDDGEIVYSKAAE